MTFRLRWRWLRALVRDGRGSQGYLPLVMLETPCLVSFIRGNCTCDVRRGGAVLLRTILSLPAVRVRIRPGRATRYAVIRRELT